MVRALMNMIFNNYITINHPNLDGDNDNMANVIPKNRKITKISIAASAGTMSEYKVPMTFLLLTIKSSVEL